MRFVRQCTALFICFFFLFCFIADVKADTVDLFSENAPYAVTELTLTQLNFYNTDGVLMSPFYFNPASPNISMTDTVSVAEYDISSGETIEYEEIIEEHDGYAVAQAGDFTKAQTWPARFFAQASTDTPERSATALVHRLLTFDNQNNTGCFEIVGNLSWDVRQKSQYGQSAYYSLSLQSFQNDQLVDRIFFDNRGDFTTESDSTEFVLSFDIVPKDFLKIDLNLSASVFQSESMAAVPEPGSAVLFFSGIIGMILVFNRRQFKS